MNFELTPEQLDFQKEIRVFVEDQVTPNANQFDKEEKIPLTLIKNLAEKGYLGAFVPKKYGGKNLDAITEGLLHEEMGRGYGSVQNLISVYGMFIKGILMCGSEEQKQHWIPKIISGDMIPAIALTEPNIGSDINSMEATAVSDGDYYVLNGKKKWTTLAQIADVFLIFAKCENKHCAFIVERNTVGFIIDPICGMLGLRANMLAELTFENCRIHKKSLVGRVGDGVSHVAAFSLDQGRYTTAWGCIGIAQAALVDTVKYARKRKQFGEQLRKHQLVQKMITEMYVSIKAARLCCYHAGFLRDDKSPDSISETLVAKYYASTMVGKVAGNAVQIHGAIGCSDAARVQRYFRDAKIMELIEGSTQMHEIIISHNACRDI